MLDTKATYMNAFNFSLVAALVILLSACGGGGSGGSGAASEREMLESSTTATMVDRVIFEQKQQKGIYQESVFSRSSIPAFGPPVIRTDVGCRELTVTDVEFLREDFVTQSSGEICASAGGSELCFGQRNMGLYTYGRDDLIFESLKLTSDELDSVVSFDVGYNLPGDTTIETTIISASASDSACTDDRITTVFAQDDIEGAWDYRVYRVSNQALPALESFGQASCTSSQCTATGTFEFGPLEASTGNGGMVINGSMTYLGSLYGTSRAVLSTDLNTMAVLACPEATGVRNVTAQYRFVIGERSGV